MDNPLCTLKIICDKNNLYTYDMFQPETSYTKPIDKFFRKQVDGKTVKLICKEIEEKACQFNQDPTKEMKVHYDSFIPLGKMLYHALIPCDLETKLNEIASPLLISTNNHDIYWELLYDGNEFWGINYMMSRQLLLSSVVYNQYYKKSTIESCEYHKTRALVIASNPKGDIPQVTVEAKKLLNWLEQNEVEYTYIPPEEASFIRVITVLETGNYDIFHYAGHIKSTSVKKSYLLLNDKNISTNDIENHAKPCRIVYLSCCESASGIESFANAFLKKKAQVVIGTLFKVNDVGSSKFAEHLYDLTFKGKILGDNLKNARLLTIENSQYGATWASFIMYGDPRFQFIKEDKFFKLKNELEIYIDNNFDKIKEKIYSIHIEHEYGSKKRYLLLDIVKEYLPGFRKQIESISPIEIYEIYISTGIKKDKEKLLISPKANNDFAEEISIKMWKENINTISPNNMIDIAQEREYPHQYLNADNIRESTFFTRDSKGNIIFVDKGMQNFVTARKIINEIDKSHLKTLEKPISPLIHRDISEILKRRNATFQQDIKTKLYNWIESLKYRSSLCIKNILTLLNMCGEDFTGKDLRRINLGGTYLPRSRFERANLQNANLGGANLSKSVFTSAILKNVNLGGANLKGTVLKGANLSGANLNGANMQGAILTPVVTESGKTIKNILKNVNMSGAKLSGAILNWAVIESGDMQGADLSESSLFGTTIKVEKEKIKGANFAGAKIDRDTKLPHNFKDYWEITWSGFNGLIIGEKKR